MADSVSMAQARAQRRAKSKDFARAAILNAARIVAARDGAAQFSLRAVAAEAGFAPAALYGYFANKNDLLLALAAEDLGGLAKVLRESKSASPGDFGAAAGAALELISRSETFAAATQALSGAATASEAERLFNGRLITALKALSEARGAPSGTRAAQADIVLLAAALTGLAVLGRSGRLAALGFSPADLIGALDRRFAAAADER